LQSELSYRSADKANSTIPSIPIALIVGLHSTDQTACAH